MKPLSLISILILFVFISCDQTTRSKEPGEQKKETPKAETPKALQSATTDVNLSRVNSNDLVESIYEELADKKPELKEIEDQIKNIEESKGDSINAFNLFNSKNNEYYLSAGSHLSEIKDSALRDKIKLLISNSQVGYNDRISKHTGLLSIVAAKGETLNDLHTVLKLLETLPVIENYQKSKLPNTASIQGIINAYNNVLHKIDGLPKK